MAQCHPRQPEALVCFLEDKQWGMSANGLPGLPRSKTAYPWVPPWAASPHFQHWRPEPVCSFSQSAWEGHPLRRSQEGSCLPFLPSNYIWLKVAGPPGVWGQCGQKRKSHTTLRCACGAICGWVLRTEVARTPRGSTLPLSSQVRPRQVKAARRERREAAPADPPGGAHRYLLHRYGEGGFHPSLREGAL